MAATILVVTVGVQLADIVGGVAVGTGTAVVFRFVLRSIITRERDTALVSGAE